MDLELLKTLYFRELDRRFLLDAAPTPRIAILGVIGAYSRTTRNGCISRTNLRRGCSLDARRARSFLQASPSCGSSGHTSDTRGSTCHCRINWRRTIKHSWSTTMSTRPELSLDSGRIRASCRTSAFVACSCHNSERQGDVMAESKENSGGERKVPPPPEPPPNILVRMGHPPPRRKK